MSTRRSTGSKLVGKDGGQSTSPPASGKKSASKGGAKPVQPVHADASCDGSPLEAGRAPQTQPVRSSSGSSLMRRTWCRAAPGLPYLLVGLSLAGAFFLGARLGTIPMQRPGLEGGGSDGGRPPGSGAAAQQGERVASEANGIFPRGCKWREVTTKGAEPGFWDIRQYEYWDAARQSWTDRQPESCLVKGVANPNPRSWKWRNGSPRSAAHCKDYHCRYENLWFNNGRFYLLVDGPKPVSGWKMSRNQDLNPLQVDNATAFVESVNTRVITGDTIIFDFVFFLHPTAIGHWSEMLFPLFSVLRLEPDFARPPTQFVLLHLKKSHLMEWVRSVLAVTLGVAPFQDLPPIMLQQETNSVWKQILAPLEGIPQTDWVCFENVLVVKDTFSGGTRTFLSREDAHLFRQMVYAQYDLPPPGHRGFVPQTITFQRKRANRQVINEAQMVKMLGEFGEVRVVEFNSSTTFKEQIETMASTGVLISVHTSNLANSQFLPPGSAVVELIQRNWIWHNLDQSFKVQTDMMGDIHHFAWRARHRNQTVYINKRDAQRFGDWEPLRCNTEECVEAHTNIDVVVNLEELRALLADRLPLVYGGYSVADAAIAWPSQT